ELLIERGVDRVGRAEDEERVAVGRRIHHHLGGDVAAGARAILDDALLSQPLEEPLTDQPRGDVGRPAGGKSDDETQWAVRISLRARDTRKRHSSRSGGQLDKLTTRMTHDVRSTMTCNCYIVLQQLKSIANAPGVIPAERA